jgi:CBS domain-containing protein
MEDLLHPTADFAHLTVAEIMSSRLVTVRESESVLAAAQIMSKSRVHRVLVVDEAGKLSGILSALDIVGLLA